MQVIEEKTPKGKHHRRKESYEHNPMGSSSSSMRSVSIDHSHRSTSDRNLPKPTPKTHNKAADGRQLSTLKSQKTLLSKQHTRGATLRSQVKTANASP